MDLFIIDNGIAKPSEHALLVEPFKTIWEEDKTKIKSTAIKSFTYIELICSIKKSNPFSGYDEDIKPEKVAKEVYKDEKYIPTELELEGIKVYKDFLEEASPTLSFYKASLKAALKCLVIPFSFFVVSVSDTWYLRFFRFSDR